MTETKAIYKLDWDVGRGWKVDGLFVADRSAVEKIMGKTIHFGEVCGKHSDIEIEMTPDVLTMVTDDQAFVAQFVELFGDGAISGHNPLDYHYEEDED